MLLFDLDSPLVCEGIIGDGCGGGRIFYINEETSSLYAYDSYAKTAKLLLENLPKVTAVSKKGCIITLTLEHETRELDLSTLQ